MAQNIDFQTLKQHTPFAQYQLVDVIFGEAHTDTEVRHTLKPPTPEHIYYTIYAQAQAATIYHDMSGSRKPWRNGVITLRSSIAGARVTLLLAVSHEKRNLIETPPAAVTPVVGSHNHDAADVISGTLDAARIPSLDASKIVSGTLDAARIPSLDASKIATGTLDTARIPNLDASKITSGILDVARIPDLSAAKITSGSLADARLSSNVPLKDGANTFSALNTFSVKPELTLGFTERGRSVAAGEWQSYSPTLTATTSNPTGVTVSGRYALIGKTVHFSVAVSFGVGATAGSGFYIVSLPTAGYSDSANRMNASVVFEQNSGAARRSGAADWLSFASGTIFMIDASAGLVTNASPWAWANGDSIRIGGSYEMA